MATSLVVDPGILSAELTDLWCSLKALSWEFEGRTWGKPDYDMTADHAYDTLTAACETIERLRG